MPTSSSRPIARSLDRSTPLARVRLVVVVALLGLAGLLASARAHAQPTATPAGVRFTLSDAAAGSVHLAGEFNSWSTSTNPLAKSSDGTWEIVLPLTPGTYRYKFVVNGNQWKRDPANPAGVDDNYGGLNSVFVLRSDGTILLAEEDPDAGKAPPSDDYPKSGGRLFLNIVWHQHQPLYLDPVADQLRGPWVRAHATKDYWDMAAILREYPDIHLNVNLTSSLLAQLQLYVDRLGPYVDVAAGRVDAGRYLAERGGHTDPWVDLALRPSSSFDARDRARLTTDAWNAFGLSEVMMARFPEYAALKAKAPAGLSADELTQVKAWFYLAWFDPRFLRGKVALDGATAVDLSDLVAEQADGTFRLRRPFGESDANRLVAEAYKVMAHVIPVHRELGYDPAAGTGQVEVMTTPFYHPILPLLIDSDLARQAMPGTALPDRFAWPADADAQVGRAVAFYERTFGRKPRGMWPGEGSVAEAIVPILVRNGIRWTASADGVLGRSMPAGQLVHYAYRVDADTAPGGTADQAMAIVFRDTPLSDKIGFRYQSVAPEPAADDFIRSILGHAPASDDDPRLLTIILDGENAWEWYRRDNDAVAFLNAVYRKLTALQKTGQVVTVTTSEYLDGNPARGIPPHPVAGLAELEPLWAGSWIEASFSTWVGESDENRAWNLLRQTREDLAASGLAAPPAGEPVPAVASTPDDWRRRAWDEMYAAEGSDWFWWYGNDQNAPGGDGPFDEAFVHHLASVYDFARKAGGAMPERTLVPILGGPAPGAPAAAGGTAAGGTMAAGSAGSSGAAAGGAVTVRFVADAAGRDVPKAIYIVGDKPELAQWTPNKVPMYDDGTHGDEAAGDGRWTVEIAWPAGTVVKYKFTNSGAEGAWSPSEEFPVTDRSVTVRDEGSGRMTVRNTFGVVN
jgi:alpha-amylase/alpha-mannosidase (GH57 family)